MDRRALVLHEIRAQKVFKDPVDMKHSLKALTLTSPDALPHMQLPEILVMAKLSAGFRAAWLEWKMRTQSSRHEAL